MGRLLPGRVIPGWVEPGREVPGRELLGSEMSGREMLGRETSGRDGRVPVLGKLGRLVLKFGLLVLGRLKLFPLTWGMLV
ncbi:hypothetical protein RISK_005905 [Rhodopirellula islandica]|uniref:Uncharacterized protein n=1 Tax=Rhodopirellula islandica TaxID=595434 RepID=A0A0J1E9A5_RHOIS|nr:hypothetical protein RISK_005905 [Rhodopirellula islandica]